MANIKSVLLPGYPTTSNAYAKVLQVATGYFLDNAGSPAGVFRAVQTDSHIPLTADIDLPSVFVFATPEDRSVWADGEYSIFAYDGGGNLFAGGSLFILNDLEVSQATILQYLQLIKKIEDGNWQLADNKWIYYDEDGVTPLLTFNVFDKDGSPSMFNIFHRVRVP